MSDTRDVILDQWRYTGAVVTEETALRLLRLVWAEYKGQQRASVVRDLAKRDIPFRAMSVPWFEYLCGSDVVRAIGPDGERL